MLITYIRQITIFYSSEQQKKVFENYRKTNSLIRHSYKGYDLLRHHPLKYSFLCLYGIRTISSFNFKRRINSPLIAFASTNNQYKGIMRIANLCPDEIIPDFVETCNGRYKRLLNIFRFTSRILQPKARSQYRKILRIVQKIENREGWIAASNTASFLFSYVAFQNICGKNSIVAFTSNDFSPVPLGFKAATEKNGLRQMFAMHGQISSSASKNLFPKLRYHLSFLYGQHALSSYMVSAPPCGKVILTGMPGTDAPMRPIVGPLRRIGIALSNFYDTDTEHHILAIAKLYPEALIFVRKHPSANDIDKIPAHPNIAISKHKDITDFSKDCDLVIAGNTGAQLDILKAGCPTAYYDGLDKLGKDDIGLVADSIVMEQKSTSSLRTTEINDFFSLDWIKKFRECDASYQRTQSETHKMRQEIRMSYLSLTEKA